MTGVAPSRRTRWAASTDGINPNNADLIRDVLRDDGSTIEELEVLLDWGCGCGRVLRHWSGLQRTFQAP